MISFQLHKFIDLTKLEIDYNIDNISVRNLHFNVILNTQSSSITRILVKGKYYKNSSMTKKVASHLVKCTKLKVLEFEDEVAILGNKAWQDMIWKLTEGCEQLTEIICIFRPITFDHNDVNDLQKSA